MFIAALFVILRSWKQLRCPTTEEWIQKKCGSFTQWTSTQLLRNEGIISFAGKLMELENTILSELTHTQRDMHDMYLLINVY